MVLFHETPALVSFHGTQRVRCDQHTSSVVPIFQGLLQEKYGNFFEEPQQRHGRMESLLWILPMKVLKT